MGNREPEAAAPDAASLEQLRHHLDERERRAEERDRAADQRDRLANERDQIADERDRIADVREWQLAKGRTPKPSDGPRLLDAEWTRCSPVRLPNFQG